MGLTDRLWRALRANINAWIAQAEDPEKLLERAIAELQEDLIRLRQSVAQAIALQRRTERQCTQAQISAQDWQKRAYLALQKGDEAIAREALTRRKPYLETAHLLEAHLKQQQGIINRLKHDLHILEAKLAETKTKKELYVARMRAAKTSAQLQQIIGQLNPSSTSAALERLENKVHQLEAEAELAMESGADSLEEQFQSLEGGNLDSVERELTAMKSQQPTETLQGYDAELEQLRSRLKEL